MTPILIVAGSALLEHTRRKLIAFFLIFSVLVMAVLIYIVSREDFSRTFNARSTDFVFLISNSVLGFLALLATLAVSMGNVGAPFMSGEAAPILARPIRRSQYALGRFLASATVVVGLCAAIALELTIVQANAGAATPGLLWGHWATTAFNLIVVAAIATLMSVAISTPIVVAILAYFIDQALGGITFARALTRAAPLPETVEGVINTLWYVTPKFLISPYQPRGQGIPSFGGNSAELVIWAVLYLIGLVAAAALLTERKEA